MEHVYISFAGPSEIIGYRHRNYLNRVRVDAATIARQSPECPGLVSKQAVGKKIVADDRADLGDIFIVRVSRLRQRIFLCPISDFG